MRRDHTDPNQLTEKQRAFADAFNSNGGHATNAYRQVYDCRKMNPSTVHRTAHDLTRHSGVSKLIGETKKLAAPPLPASENPADVSKQWLIAEAMRAYNQAMRSGQSGASKNLLELIGKLSGILVERKELRVIRSLSDLSDEELEALIASDPSDGDETRH
jgi:hypothetical protein